MISHHSHSGSFCKHAKDSLEEIVQRAIELGFVRYCLTEHIPRLYSEHLYPEEVDGEISVQDLADTFEAYIIEARRLQKKYMNSIEILVGFETEGISDEYLEYVLELKRKYNPDLFVGSLHHCGKEGTPIDFDQLTYDKALSSAGNSTESLYSVYFEQQYRLIDKLSPPVIGHFDLIRLFTPKESEINDLHSSPEVWKKIERNIDLAISRGCLFELNSAALSKGWDGPYPKRDITKLIIAKGGKFCLSDDAHSIAHVGRNYDKLADYLQEMNIEQVYTVGNCESITAKEFKAWAERLST